MSEDSNELEQGFNDDELEDIMNEIEELEKDFAEESEPEPTPGPECEIDDEPVLEAAPEPDPEPDFEEEAPVCQERPTPVVRPAVCQEKVVPLKPAHHEHGGPETQMDFSVSGQMNLKLNFCVGGQYIHLHVNEEQGFIIEMDGGIKFSIPLGNNIKKAS